MGILNAIKGQLIDVIEWSDSSSKTMVHKYDMNGKEIMMGAQLTVRESQVAIFVNEGELADVFEPGRYELQTSNMPILTALKSWKYGFNSPFKSDVYFVNTKQFLDMKWGTSNPVMMRDAEFGMIRVRAFGIYSFKVSDPAIFLKEVDGTNTTGHNMLVIGAITVVTAIQPIVSQSSREQVIIVQLFLGHWYSMNTDLKHDDTFLAKPFITTVWTNTSPRNFQYGWIFASLGRNIENTIYSPTPSVIME